jgi:hypothetical protein
MIYLDYLIGMSTAGLRVLTQAFSLTHELVSNAVRREQYKEHRNKEFVSVHALHPGSGFRTTGISSRAMLRLGCFNLTALQCICKPRLWPLSPAQDSATLIVRLAPSRGLAGVQYRYTCKLSSAEAACTCMIEHVQQRHAALHFCSRFL